MGLKTIVFDIDGTLVNKSSPMIDEHIITAVKVAKTKGIKILLATGRPLHLIDEHIITSLKPDGYVTINGQTCFDASYSLIHDAPLSPKTIKDFKRFISDHNYEFGLHTQYESLFNLKGNMYNIIYKMLSRDHGRIIDPKDINWDQPIYTIMLYSTQEQIIHQFINQHQDLRFDEFKPDCYDIFNEVANKAKGIEHFLKLWNLSWNEVLSFGDSTNDVEMLQQSEWGYLIEGGPKSMEKLQINRIPFYPRVNIAQIILEHLD